MHRGFVTETGARPLADLPRYLRAIERRLERLPREPGPGPGVDGRGSRRSGPSTTTCSPALPPNRRDDEEVGEIRWMIEELRMSLFAQALGTPYPVSEQRIYRAMDVAEGR